MTNKNNHGGPGRGGGRHKIDEPRNVVKQVRWTEAEWLQVVAAAEEAGQQPSGFIRDKVLGKDMEATDNCFRHTPSPQAEQATQQLNLAEQQILGWYSATVGESLFNLVSCMGLKRKEWEKLRGLVHYLSVSQIEEIDKYFA